jgi:signal transduction histidine kinase
MKTQKRLFLFTKSRRLKWGIVIGLAVVYIWSFKVILTAFGVAGTPLIALPVIAAGWFWGLPGGVLSALIAIPLTIFLLWINAYGPISQVGREAIPGLLLLLFVGAITGTLRKWGDDTLRIEKTLRSRERYFALCNMIIQSILTGQNLQEIYHQLANQIAQLFEADFAYLTKWDGEHGQNILVATTFPLHEPVTGFSLPPNSASVVETVMQNGHALPIDDTFNAPYIIAPSGMFDCTKVRSVLGIPIIAQEYTFGVAVVCFDAPHSFTEEDVSRAEQAGQNICLALWSILQREELHARLKEADALAEIERTLSETERISLQTVLQNIVNSAKTLISGSEQAVIHLVDEEGQVLVPQAVAGFDSPQPAQTNMRLGEGAAGQAIASGQIINIADITTDARFVTPSESPTCRSLLVAPIYSADKPLGTISVQSNRILEFSRNDERLLQRLSTQAAIAIENARLLDSTRQSVREIEALYRINQVLIGSIEPSEVMKQVVDLLQKNFGYYYVQIYAIDKESGDLVLQEGTGQIGNKLKEREHRLSAGTGIVGHVAQTGQAFMTNNVDQVTFFYRNPLCPSTKAELAVPINIKGKIIGVLDVQLPAPGAFHEHDLHVVSGVADQLAMAWEKANLYADLQSALEQEKAMRMELIKNDRLIIMGRLLASVSHELNNPLQAIQNALFLLRQEGGLNPQACQDLEIILSETERMAAMIARLRATYRPVKDEEFQAVDLNMLVEDVYALVATHLRRNRICFVFHPDPSLPLIPGLPNQLRQVLLNLIMNAVDAMTDGGKLDVLTLFLPENGKVFLSVTDNGPGIDPAILPHIFNAFVTTKPNGTGLGLAISYDIILKHNGRIEAKNNPEGGATFSIWLPAGAEKDV